MALNKISRIIPISLSSWAHLPIHPMNPYWNEDGTLNANGCEATSAVTVNEDGEIVIDTAANYQSGNYDLYLVEVPINEEGTTFDKTIYIIHVSVSANPVTTSLLGININRYVVDANTSKVSVKKKNGTEFTDYDGFYSWSTDTADSAVSTVKIGNGANPAFMNELAPYKTSGTWHASGDEEGRWRRDEEVQVQVVC